LRFDDANLPGSLLNAVFTEVERARVYGLLYRR
jgi:hypothetical protein